MAVFKCKMCGGNIEFNPGDTVGICDSCGTKQTLPKLDDDCRTNLYDRANHFRRNNEFDKAMSIYEKILEEDNTDAETYWSIVLCRYGIEYVEDPATHKRVPTVNRAQYSSVVSDKDYKSALKYGTPEQKELYKAEARAIDKIQKGILEISQKEEPFDVFICYKETDNQGRRTPDSVLANDLYHQLVQEGFKVFFSRITLEDKLGTAYEPYIFAALNSAKVMVVLGTKPEYFNAVWVKNEWNRYLALVNASSGKKMLIPAYKDMDPYDLPEEFSHLQAQDMSKLGFMQDLIRGIKKIVSADTPTKVVKETTAAAAPVSPVVNTAPLLERAFMFLEDGNWEDADTYCEKVLDQDPKNAQAYLGKLMAELQVNKQEDLKNCGKVFDTSSNYQKAVRFGDDDFSEQLKADNEENQKYIIYHDALKAMRKASDEAGFKNAASKFDPVAGYKDSDSLKEQCLEKAEAYRKDGIYQAARKLMTGLKTEPYEAAISKLETIPGWKDADEQIEVCRNKIEEIKEQVDFDRLEAERKAEQFNIKKESFKQKLKIALKFGIPIIAAIVVIIIVLNVLIIPNAKYKKATKLMEEKDYQSAITYFEKLNGFKDSAEQIENCNSLIVEEKYMDAYALFEEKKYSDACTIFDEISDYKDSKEKADTCNYQMGVSAYQEKNYKEAVEYLEKTNNKDREKYLYNACFLYAEECYDNSNTDEALTYYKKLTDKNLMTETMNQSIYKKAVKNFEVYIKDFESDDKSVYSEISSVLFKVVDGYKNTKDLQTCINEIKERESWAGYGDVLNKLKDVCSKDTFDYVVKLNSQFTAYNNLINHAGIYRSKIFSDGYASYYDYIRITKDGYIQHSTAEKSFVTDFDDSILHGYDDGEIDSVINANTFETTVTVDSLQSDLISHKTYGYVTFIIKLKEKTILISEVEYSNSDAKRLGEVQPGEYVLFKK